MRGSLLTNVERKRRHLTVEDGCDIFHGRAEDVSHVLRICVLACSAWDKLVKGERMIDFLSMPFRDWFIANLMGKGGFVTTGTDWSMLFAVLCWKLWNHHNRVLFDADFNDREKIVTTNIQYVRLLKKVDSPSKLRAVQSNEATGVNEKWRRSMYGWVKLNVDGAGFRKVEVESDCREVLRFSTEAEYC
ncbi:hypothetical protein V6N13_147601 [Hibiscus sabdariffa]